MDERGSIMFSYSDILKIKEESSKELREIGDKYQTDFSKLQVSLDSKLSSYDQKINAMSNIINQLQESIYKATTDSSKINETYEFKKHAEDKLISLDLKTRNIDKDISDMSFKYDRLICDNLNIPSLIGIGAKFSNMKAFIEYTLREFNSTLALKEKINAEQHKLQNYVDTTIKQFNQKVKQLEEVLKRTIDQVIKNNEASVKLLTADYSEKLENVRIEGNKNVKEVTDLTDRLTNEWKKIEEIRDDLLSKYEGYKKEYGDNTVKIEAYYSQTKRDVENITEANKSIVEKYSKFNKGLASLEDDVFQNTQYISKIEKIVLDFQGKVMEALNGQGKNNFNQSGQNFYNPPGNIGNIGNNGNENMNMNRLRAYSEHTKPSIEFFREKVEGDNKSNSATKTNNNEGNPLMVVNNTPNTVNPSPVSLPVVKRETPSKPSTVNYKSKTNYKNVKSLLHTYLSQGQKALDKDNNLKYRTRGQGLKEMEALNNLLPSSNTQIINEENPQMEIHQYNIFQLNNGYKPRQHSEYSKDNLDNTFSIKENSIEKENKINPNAPIFNKLNKENQSKEFIIDGSKLNKGISVSPIVLNKTTNTFNKLNTNSDIGNEENNKEYSFNKNIPKEESKLNKNSEEDFNNPKEFKKKIKEEILRADREKMKFQSEEQNKVRQRNFEFLSNEGKEYPTVSVGVGKNPLEENEIRKSSSALFHKKNASASTIDLTLGNSASQKNIQQKIYPQIKNRNKKGFNGGPDVDDYLTRFKFFNYTTYRKNMILSYSNNGPGNSLLVTNSANKKIGPYKGEKLSPSKQMKPIHDLNYEEYNRKQNSNPYYNYFINNK